jgi:hypothetical protein
VQYIIKGVPNATIVPTLTKLGTIEPVALGFRAHSGWTVVVAVALPHARPVVLERSRMQTADAAIPGSMQPYHAAQQLDDVQKAETLIQTCSASSTKLATDLVSALIANLAKSGHRAVASGILFASGRPLPDLAATLRSHPLIHTAEGEFFRNVLVQASEHCSLPVTRVKERDVWDRGAAALGLRAADLHRLIRELGPSLGPPWRQDEKLASLAAWIALAESTLT